MIEQLNIYIFLIFAFVILICALVLLFVTPSAVKEYNEYATTVKMSSANDKEKGMSAFMEELSVCFKEDRIEQLIKLIKEEIGQIQNTDGMVRLRQRDSAKQWLENFSISMHINDLKAGKVSRQITFDKRKKDFKLMIPKK